MSDPLVESHQKEASHAAAIAEEARAKAQDAQMRAAIHDMFTTEFMDVIQAGVSSTIRTTVNGRIEKLREENNDGMDTIKREIADHNQKHEADMQEIKPILVSYKKAKADVDTAVRGGRTVIWLAATVTAIGGAYLVLRMIFFNH